MVETVAAGLLLATVSGLTYLAYKHPHAYRKLWPPLWITLVGAYVLINAWMSGAKEAHIRLIPLIDMSKQEEAHAAIEAMLPRWWVVCVIFLGGVLYLGFLRYLPQLLKEEQDKEPDSKSPDKEDK